MLGRLGHSLGFYDAALLFETGGYRQFPLVVVVAAPVEMQQRLSTRSRLVCRGCTCSDRYKMPLEEKVAKADMLFETMRTY